MALQYVQSRQPQRRNSILGTIGTLATLGGMATGLPWLGALGTFASGTDALINGGGSGNSGNVVKETGGALNELLKGLKDAPSSITDNNIAKTPVQQATDKMKKIAEKTGETDASSSVRASSTNTPEFIKNLGKDYTDSNGNLWEWYNKGGCFGTGGHRPYSPFNSVWDIFRG